MSDGLSYIKGTGTLVDGKVVDKFEDGNIAFEASFQKGMPIGDWNSYTASGKRISYGYGVKIDGKEFGITNYYFKNSTLSFNNVADINFLTLNLADSNTFKNNMFLLDVANGIFNSYKDDRKFSKLIIFDSSHEFVFHFDSGTIVKPFFDTLSIKPSLKINIR
jgi:antitoxin component YwqK of YwqJK toxin-antitoxin module